MSFKEGRSEQGLLFFIRNFYKYYYENNVIKFIFKGD